MRRLIRTDGTYLDFENPLSHDAIARLIGCETMDTVSLADRVHVMCLDDLGAKKGLPLNVAATKFYWEKCGGPVDWAICGDVVIAPDDDYASPVRSL